MSENSASGTRSCPNCAETIHAAAKVCRFCGAKFDGAGQAVRKGGGCGAALVWIAVIAAVLVGGFLYLSAQGSQMLAAADRAWEAQRMRPEPSGLHCLDPSMNLLHPDLYVAVKRSLHNPDSIRDMRMQIAPVAADGTHEITFTYRALNLYGALQVQSVTGKVAAAGCDLLSWK